MDRTPYTRLRNPEIIYPFQERYRGRYPSVVSFFSVHRDHHKQWEEKPGTLGGGDGLFLHPDRAQSRLKPGEPLISSLRLAIFKLMIRFINRYVPQWSLAICG